eukprot:TRINITY_DN44887_c0_g1_i1.p1 TRINITY_DN44887_c0_g1~~TRINITY_DN44887_c0_g1_i1.p1  ORF type:complete len:124 (+),score=34.41 TRINITY_DN44887_c0_g1_i1:98-469(+)
MCSTAPPNLVVMMSFNPPVITIIGPIKEKTVEHLNVLLPSVCTTSKDGRKPLPKFQKKVSPGAESGFWHVELRGQYCDQVGTSFLFSALFDSLDEEGRWRLNDTNAVSTPEGETYKFFFVKRA